MQTQTQTLLDDYAGYLQRHLPRFGIRTEDVQVLLRDLIAGRSPEPKKSKPARQPTFLRK